MTDTPDIVDRLRAWPEGSEAPEIACSHRLCDPIMSEAAIEIERLRVACAGALVVAERATDECVKLHEQCDRLARGQVKLRRWMDSNWQWCVRSAHLHASAADVIEALNADRRRWKSATEDRDAEIERLHARLDELISGATL